MVTQNYFYDTLSPYGGWVNVESYGMPGSRQSSFTMETGSRIATMDIGFTQLRLVLGFGLFVGLGDVSLWPLVSSSAPWLVLVAGHNLGAVMGHVALFRRLLWSGAVATAHGFIIGRRDRFSGPQHQRRV